MMMLSLLSERVLYVIGMLYSMVHVLVHGMRHGVVCGELHGRMHGMMYGVCYGTWHGMCGWYVGMVCVAGMLAWYGVWPNMVYGMLPVSTACRARIRRLHCYKKTNQMLPGPSGHSRSRTSRPGSRQGCRVTAIQRSQAADAGAMDARGCTARGYGSGAETLVSRG